MSVINKEINSFTSIRGAPWAKSSALATPDGFASFVAAEVSASKAAASQAFTDKFAFVTQQDVFSGALPVPPAGKSDNQHHTPAADIIDWQESNQSYGLEGAVTDSMDIDQYNNIDPSVIDDIPSIDTENANEDDVIFTEGQYDEGEGQVDGGSSEPVNDVDEYNNILANILSAKFNSLFYNNF